MKCSIMLHFIWVFTVCQSTDLGVSYWLAGYCLYLIMQYADLSLLNLITILCYVIQVAAEAENNDNELEQRRQHGKRVRYGELVQVGFRNYEQTHKN